MGCQLIARLLPAVAVAVAAGGHRGMAEAGTTGGEGAVVGVNAIVVIRLAGPHQQRRDGVVGVVLLLLMLERIAYGRHAAATWERASH